MIQSVRVDPGTNHGFNGGSVPRPAGMSGSKSPNLISDIFPEPNPEGRIFTSPEKGEEIEFLNRAAGFFQNKLEFRYDEATGRIVARVIDRDSGEEVKQIPSQEALDAVFRLEKLKGVLFDETD